MIHTKSVSVVCLLVAVMMLVLQVGIAQGASTQKYTRTVEKYTTPDVTLVNQDGKKVQLLDLIEGEKPVLLDFIFGTCTTICPILSASFTSMQDRLGPDIDKVRFISVSIDPEHDTPEVMKSYLDRYGAKPGWDFLTGTREDINKVMQAFDAYVTNKMDHRPLTFLHVPGSDNWVRIYGLLGTSDLMKEYNSL